LAFACFQFSVQLPELWEQSLIDPTFHKMICKNNQII
jgi:hypothetical protein